MDEQKKIEFVPNPQQLAFAEAYILHKGNVSAASAQTGDKGRNNYYNWRKEQEGFEGWLADYAKKSVLKRIGKWYLIAEQYAEQGSFQHLNMLMQIAKEFCPREMQLNNTVINNRVESGQLTEATRSFLRFIAEANNRTGDVPETKE